MSGKQLNASAELVLHHPVNARCVEDETPDLEITEPPTKKSKSHSKKTVRQWTRDDLQSESTVAVDPPTYHEKQWSPAEVFEFFFDDEIIELIIRFSKTYAVDKGAHQFHVTMEEMRAFLAVLLLSGYATLPRRRMY